MDKILSQHTDLIPSTIGKMANQAAAKSAFADYRTRKAEKTITRQDGDLALFAEYLQDIGASVFCLDLNLDPDCWQGITWGLVEGFIKWQLNRGYAVSSVNVRLSTVKAYAKLAVKAGILDPQEYALIRTVSGYSRKEGKRLDEHRQEVDLPTRIDRPGAKKKEAVSLSKAQAKQLKNAGDDSPQGRRDNLLMCLLLDHGLRCNEVEGLTVDNFDLAQGEMTFYRSKVDKTQTHKLTADTLRAARAYFERDAPAGGLLLLGSRKNGSLSDKGMSTRAITKRVKTLGTYLGIDSLSAHDCRHYAATYHAKTKDVKQLMEIFGWNSPAMAVRYIEDAKVIELE